MPFIFGVLMWIKLAPWIACVVLTGLWLDARDAVIEEREACNAGVIQAALDGERLTFAAEKRQLQKDLEDMASVNERERESARIAKAAERAAQSDTATREETITRLQLEASIDEIPDSGECLNVFVLERSLDRVLYPSACPGEGTSTGSGDDPLCGSAEELDGADPAFSNITYADALKIWGRDRDIIQILNGQLMAIDNLSKDE